MVKKLTKENQAILPVAIPKFSNIKSMSTYANYSFIITNENQVYGFGDNKKGRIGLGAQKAQDNILAPELVESLKNIHKINGGTFHSLALDNSGVAFSAGNKTCGQLGREDGD